ncbi:methyltransferase [Ruegeria hyattellae]|uniref:methyltransferase n=1 Tax=Ruegeria hyattellae TaxID=3233337 RepID=UPI00355B8E15
MFDNGWDKVLGRQMEKASENQRSPGLWKGQLLHFGSLFALLMVVTLAWNALGKPHSLAFWIAVAFPVLHQVWVWLAWRLELKASMVSRSIGFAGYLMVFFLLFAGRFLSLAWLAFLDHGSLGFAPMLVALLTLLLLLPGLYAMYSVKRYFGMSRAAGGDHFDQNFRYMPLVKEGIFRFTDNGMYFYAFLLFWAIAIGFNSAAAVVAAAFSHAYIWVHFYATEKPDMEYLYGSGNS